ncbi:MAG: magnesium transporter CorA family protein [Patescibacteria group bacterium]
MKNIGKKVEWVDIERPTKKDISYLKERFKLHDVILREIEEPSARAHVERYDDYLYMTCYFPIYDGTEQTSRRAEIDFVIMKKAVVTVRYERLDVLNDFKSVEFKDSLSLVYSLLGALAQFEERQLRHIGEKVEEIGNELFKNKEREVLKKLSHLKRDISEYRIIVRYGEAILHSLMQHGIVFWGEESRIYLNDVLGDQTKIIRQIEDYREAISDFEDTNNQIMNSKTTEVMKTFTTLSFLTFPFMLFAALFSMNVKSTPLVDYPHAFWIILAIMASGMSVLVLYFRRKDWL